MQVLEHKIRRNAWHSMKNENQYLQNWKVIASKNSELCYVIQYVKAFVVMLEKGIWKTVIGYGNMKLGVN